MRLLHAGCGSEKLPPQLAALGAEEVRLDIDPATKPDIVASIHDLGDIGPFDAVYTAHCLEHLHWDAAKRAVSEFHRVLAPNGFALIVVPDLDGIRPTGDVIYDVPGLGGITGMDMIYGYRGYTATNPYMVHRCGFVAETLRRAMEAAGFDQVSTSSEMWNLMGLGVKR